MSSAGEHKAQGMSRVRQLGRRVADLYIDGFRNMTIGRSLWALIIIKVVIIFAVLKVFFFPDILATNYDTDAERATAVRHSLTH